MARLAPRTIHPDLVAALERFDRFPVATVPSRRLPLVEWLVGESGLVRRSLEGVRVLFIQHHLGPLVGRLAALERVGLDRSLCHFVDIPYSTNPEARTAIHRGVPREQVAGPFDDPLFPYTEAQGARVLAALRRIAEARRREPFLVVDDGGYFPRALQTLARFDPGMARKFRRTRVVEQTTRGHRVWEGSADLARDYSLSVVSIALTRTKEEIEAPFIGATVRRRIARVLPLKKMTSDRTLVLGHGRIGQAVVAALQREGLEDIAVVDPAFAGNRSRREAAKAQGLQPLPFLPAHVLADLVIGCTGRASLRPHQRPILADGATLVSCSSAAVEFNREGFVELADEDPKDAFHVVAPHSARRRGIRATLRFRDGSRAFSFLHAGFPVNFDGAMECVPAHLIQSTHALMVAAMFEAMAAPVGVRTLSSALDRRIGAEAIRHVLRPI